MKFSQIERGINNFSAASRGGIKNLTESFIPFYHTPRELKNDNSLSQFLPGDFGGNAHRGTR